MDPREFSHAGKGSRDASCDVQPEYRITITLAVHDVAGLWSAAAAKAMAAPGMRIEDVLDTLGAREAPSVTDCIAMLTAPAALAGCSVDDFWIDCLPNLPARSALDRLAEAEGTIGRLPTPLAR